MSSEQDDAKHGSLLLPFLVGTLAGVAAVMLLAPRLRRQTAERITEFARELKQRAATGADAARERVSAAVAKGRGYLDE